MTRSVLVLLLAMVFASCGNNKTQNRGPIVLGDSSTIVTETDPKYLTNYVDDIKVIPDMHEDTSSSSSETTTTEPTASETTTTVTQNTAPKQEETPAPKATTPQGNGLNVPFNVVNAFIPNIETRSFQKIDFNKSTGASYQLTDGKLNGNVLKILSGNITKVSMRYKTVVIASNDLGMMEIEGLANLTDWQAINGRNGTYPITGLDARHLKHDNANNRQIRNYVNRTARNKRMSRAMINKWENAVRRVRSVNQSPLSVELRSVMFKIEGKDAKGKYFQKQIRIDIPISN